MGAHAWPVGTWASCPLALILYSTQFPDTCRVLFLAVSHLCCYLVHYLSHNNLKTPLVYHNTHLFSNSWVSRSNLSLDALD